MRALGILLAVLGVLVTGTLAGLCVFAWWLVSGNQRWLKPKPRLVTFRRA